ncbi:MAG: hypothetical protein ACRCWL_01050, partial [Aeromonas sp.]
NNGTALAGPVVLQLQDQALKGFDIEFLHNFFSREVKIRARFAECEPKEYTVWHGRIIGEIAGDSRDGALLSWVSGGLAADVYQMICPRGGGCRVSMSRQEIVKDEGERAALRLGNP